MKRFLVKLISACIFGVLMVSCGVAPVGEREPYGANYEQYMRTDLSTASYRGSSSDVMLQAFAWQSKWNGQHGQWYNGLNSMASSIADAGFTVLWFPPPSKTIRYDLGENGDWSSACGYMPLDYKDPGWYQQWVYCGATEQWYEHAGHKTLYGSGNELMDVLANFRNNYSITVMADAVLGHRAARQKNIQGEWNSWRGADGYTVASGFAPWGKADTDYDPIQILNEDGGSGGYAGSWSWNGRTYYNERVAYAASISHWYSTTRNDLKEYVYWLVHTIGFRGFRYDMTRAYDPAYIGEYNDHVGNNVWFSVAEHWVDDRQEICDVVNRSGQKTRVFDFPTKYRLNQAIGSGEYWRLADGSNQPSGGIGWWPTRMVTFVDNHDTGYSAGGGQQHLPIPGGGGDTHQVRQAYVYILTHSGVPCVYWYHWNDCGADLKSFINSLISLRQSKGIVDWSSVYIQEASQNLYAAYIGGPTDSVVAMKIGSSAWNDNGYLPDSGSQNGWSVYLSGNNYKVWVKN